MGSFEEFQSTLPTRGSDFMYARARSASRRISIHAPTRGSDRYLWPEMRRIVRISIHAPHEGERPVAAVRKEGKGAFQSTLPTRGSDEE